MNSEYSNYTRYMGSIKVPYYLYGTIKLPGILNSPDGWKLSFILLFAIVSMTITYTTFKHNKWTHDYNTMQNRQNHASMNKE